MADAVRVYSMPDCGHCKQVKQILTRLEVPFEDFDLTTNVEGQQFMDAHGYRVVPVVTVGDETLIGGDTVAVRAALSKHGLI